MSARMEKPEDTWNKSTRGCERTRKEEEGGGRGGNGRKTKVEKEKENEKENVCGRGRRRKERERKGMRGGRGMGRAMQPAPRFIINGLLFSLISQHGQVEHRVIQNNLHRCFKRNSRKTLRTI